MNKLTELEQKLHISYPEIYKNLYTNGMLNWGESGSNWYEDTFPKLKENPPLLLFGGDIEIWDPIEYKAGIAEILNREVYDIAEKFKLVPFAKNGAGDLFCFQYDLQNGEDIPISYFPHDDCMLQVLAKNFQDFIFRQLLEAVTEIYEYSMFDEDEDETEIKENLENQLRTHKPYLTAKQISILEKICARDIFEYAFTLPNGHEDTSEGLATLDEVEKIVKAEIDFEYLNKAIDYTT